MDPSSLSKSDPRHPSQSTPFALFPTSNPLVSSPVSALNDPHCGGPPGFAIRHINNHLFKHRAQPQSQPQNFDQLHASSHRPYVEMICEAIAALNEPEGSTRLAISIDMMRKNSNLPGGHAALLLHHLNTLTANGVLVMDKNSYKFAAPSPPESVAVAAAAAAARLKAPKSENLPIDDIAVIQQGPLNPVASVSRSVSVPQKRGRGRPPKPKPQAQQPIIAQPIAVHANGLPSYELALTVTDPTATGPTVTNTTMTVTNPTEEVQVMVTAKRGPGRPRKDGSAPISRAGGSGVMKRRGRPPGRRAAGRQRKPRSVSANTSVSPYVPNGARRSESSSTDDTTGAIVVAPTVVSVGASEEIVAVAPEIKRRRGRPPRSVSANTSVSPYVPNGARRSESSSTGDTTGAIVVAPTGVSVGAGGEIVAVAPEIKRGRGRPPRIGGVLNKVITKPKGGRGRPGRPRKNTTRPVIGASGTQVSSYEELKRKFDLFQEKALEIVNVLRAELGTDNPAVIEAILKLEGLGAMETVEPEVMEEVQPEEPAPQTEVETQTGAAPQTETETQGVEQGHTQMKTET